MQCSDVRSHLPLHVGADLEAPLAERVDEHLETCAPCAQELADAQRVRGGLLELRDGRNPAEVDLWEGIRGELQNEGLLRGQPLPSVRGHRREVRGPRGTVWRLASAAAAAGLLGLLWTQSSRDSALDGGAEVPALVAPAAAGDSGLASVDVTNTSAPAGGVQDLVPGTGSVLGLGNLVTPVSNGLRRASAGDERMRDSALPFSSRYLNLPVNGNAPRGGTLAGDRELR